MLTVILVATQLEENLGSVARIMGNFGLNDLRLVNPQVDPLDDKALATAVAAGSILQTTRIFNDLTSAISDLHYVFGSSAGERDMVKPYFDPSSAIKKINQIVKVGLVFGGERSGLNNDDINLCHGVIHVPVDESLSSLNLAQAVAIILYEWYKTHTNFKSHLRLGATHLAEQHEILFFLTKLELLLDQKNFWRVQSKKPIMWRNLRNCILRMEPSQQELKTLHGMLDCLNK